MKKSIFIQCFMHQAPWVQRELEALGYVPEKTSNAGVWMKGDMQDCMKLNYCLRTANRVLYELESFHAENPDQLYRQLMRVSWERIIPKNGYVSVHGYVKNDTIRDNRFAFMKAKDAIVDRIQDKTGSRPDAGPNLDKSVVYLHWFNDQVIVYLDTSGETIAKHGYRKIPGKAPMMESLAAAVLLATQWDGSKPLVNPMCGSGTIAIEAALMAKNIYPGSFRSNYGFMHTNDYSPELWSRVKADIPKETVRFPRIIASDHDRNAIRAARKNAEAAGVEDKITFVTCDFTETRLPQDPGIVILNPEYGERLGEQGELENTYSQIGDYFKNKAQGYTGYIFTGNLDLAKRVGLRTKSRIPFFNARIECRLLEYELYSGTRKKEQK